MQINDLTYLPRILVISNNPFSDVENNGKTLASFFRHYSRDKIAQLYFDHTVPSEMQYYRYFRISDTDILRRLFTRNATCGSTVRPESQESDTRRSRRRSVPHQLARLDSTRIIREALWATRVWRTEALRAWLDEFSPEMVFFLAGDSGFAYDIAEYVQNRYDARLTIYVTDDYILPRRTLSPFWWIRRTSIHKRLADAVNRSDLFVTISASMRTKYRELLHKDSILAANIPNSLKSDFRTRTDAEGQLVLVYAGGLHFRRYLTLGRLVESIANHNRAHQGQSEAILRVYSLEKPSRRVLKRLESPGAGEFCGGVDSSALRNILNCADILVHVESFDRRSRESTRLSLSTKLPEYLSLGKPVLAIGPAEIASMQYCSEFALCITDPSHITTEMPRLLLEPGLRADLSARSSSKYRADNAQHPGSNPLLEEILRASQ